MNGFEGDSVSYCVHHNWEWVVEEAMRDICAGQTVTKVARSRELPGVKTPGYSLFRFVAGDTHVRITSSLFESLDAKDALYDAIGTWMPPSLLLEIDADRDNEAVRMFIDNHKDEKRGVMLKASLGAGGFGLYFCQNEGQVMDVMISHLKRAQNKEGFLERLKEQHNGRVPRWSLQKVINPVLVNIPGSPFP